MTKKTTILVLALITLPVIAEDKRPTQIFEAPEEIKMVKPTYPVRAASRGSEGWVMVNYMVDKNGKVFEPTTLSSVGPKSFEKAALEAIGKSTFKPAQIDGMPVEASGYIQYSFILKSRSGAAASFTYLYKALMKALDQENKDEADDLLEKLAEREFFRHYESSYLSVAKSRYAAAYGSPVDEMEHLRDALRHDNYYKNNTEVFPEEFQKSIRTRLFLLEIENKRYADAILTYQTLREANGDGFVEPFNSAYQQMVALATNEVSYSVPLTLDENGYAFFNLHKSGLYLEAEPSSLQEIKLRCRAKYVFFAFESDKNYQIPDSWRPCTVEILGKGHANFRLVQF